MLFCKEGVEEAAAEVGTKEEEGEEAKEEEEGEEEGKEGAEGAEAKAKGGAEGAEGIKEDEEAGVGEEDVGEVTGVDFEIELLLVGLVTFASPKETFIALMLSIMAVRTKSFCISSSIVVVLQSGHKGVFFIHDFTQSL